MASCAFHPEFEARSRCTRCETAICAACERMLSGAPYCPGCEEELTRKLAAQRAGAEAGASVAASERPPVPPPPARPLGPPPGRLRPLAFALAAGLIGAFAWYLTVRFSDYKLGLVAVGVGWLVGRATVFGAGERGSAGLAVGSVLVALGAMLFGEYLILHHFAHAAFAAERPDVAPPAYLGLSMFLSLYRETVGILDVVFYALGAYEAWKLPASAPRA